MHSKTIYRLQILFFSLLFAMLALPGSANAAGVPMEPKNGIPLVILRIDEKAGGEYKTIEEMNDSEDHSVRCTGTVEIKVPEGYSGGYGAYDLPEGELKLDYIRGRGNTTWTEPKKPYKLQLAEKQDLFGMGRSKEWGLIANAYDPSLEKNRLTYWLGARIGLPFTPQQVPVDVVMEGKNTREYLGSYCLSELVKVEESRVAIDKLSKSVEEETGDPNITGGYLLSLYTEAQNSDEPASTVFCTKAGVEMINKTPSYDSEDLKAGEAAQRAYIRNYIQELEDLIMRPEIDEETHAQIAERMDLVSAADYWWINEFAENGDAYGTSSTYFYKERDGKLFFGPLWDFDFAWGEPGMNMDFEQYTTGFTNTSMIWLDSLREKDPAFGRLIEERWSVVSQALDRMVEEGGVMDQYRDEVRLSQKADYRKWHPIYEDYSWKENYDAAVENLRKWILARKAFCDQNIKYAGSTHASVSFEVDGEVRHVEKQLLWSQASEPALIPQKEGKIFSGWVEKETGRSIEEVMLTGETTFTAGFADRDRAVASKGLYLARYEDWTVFPQDYPYQVDYEVFPENATCRWAAFTSSDERIAAPKGIGTFDLKGTGDVTITAKTYDGFTKKLLLHVVAREEMKPATGIVSNPQSLSMKKGQSKQLQYTLLPKNQPHMESASYESDNPDVADVDITKGVVYAKKNGTANITIAFYGEDEETHMTVCKVMVGKKNTLSVKAGKVRLTAKALSKKKAVISRARAMQINGAKGKLSFAKVSVSPKSAAGKFSVNAKTGVITVAKNTKKGTYRIKVRVSAAGNADYAPASRTVDVEVQLR